jgi:two-component system LytT family response regulator
MDCIIVDDEEMSSSVLKHMVNQISYLRLIKTCNSAPEVTEALKTEKVDLLFLDIEMPGMNGLALLKSLSPSPLVILTTSHTQYALEAFEQDVVDYLVKPIEFSKLLKSVEKAKAFYDQMNKQAGTFNQDYLFLKKNALLNKVPVKDILWIEALGDYVTFHTIEGNYTLHITLKSLEKKLPADKFHRIHRSYIIQLEHISSIDDNVISIGNKLIPVGSLYKDNFLSRLNFL